MKVLYNATTFPTRHNRLGVILKPGENEYDDETARKLIDLGLVSPIDPPSIDEAEPQFDTTLDNPREEAPPSADEQEDEE